MDVLTKSKKTPTSRIMTFRLIGASLGVALAAFLVTEFMHYLLVPDIGRLRERLLAEVLSALAVGLLAGGLLYAANQRRQFAMLRMQVIDEMNHHIRNALAAISLTTDSLQNQQAIRVIFESVEHIDWALREILPRSTPLRDEDRNHLWFFHATRKRTQSRPEGGDSASPPLHHREEDCDASVPAARTMVGDPSESSRMRDRLLVAGPLRGSASAGQITTSVKTDLASQRRRR
jgi:hypothetical protein